MGLSDFSLVTTWGFWIFGIVLILTIALWCHGVNKKLLYILGRLEKIERRAEQANASALKKNINAAADKFISPMVAVYIIGVAIFVLFIIPIWFINR